jgi:hypothetical protein
MYARVVRWEGAEADAMREATAQIEADASQGPPEGVPTKGFLLLNDPDDGRVMAVSFFETEEDYRQGDQALNEMDPPGGGFGQRTAVEKYEVGARIDL